MFVVDSIGVSILRCLNLSRHWLSPHGPLSQTRWMQPMRTQKKIKSSYLVVGFIYVIVILSVIKKKRSDTASPLCFNRDPNVGFEWIWPCEGLPKVHPQTWVTQENKEGGCSCAHQKHWENPAIHWWEILEVCGHDITFLRSSSF